ADAEPEPDAGDGDGDELADAEPADETGALEGAKDYDAVRAEFVETLAKVFAAGDDLTRRQLAGQVRSQLRQAGLAALNEGIAVGAGAAPESLSQTELAAFRDWQARQSAHVTDLGSAL